MNLAPFRTSVFLILAGGLFPSWSQAGSRDHTLKVYWIDCDGGSSTLIVTPQNESILIDAGFPGPRDPARIVVAAKDAGITRIDHFILTHFHRDHFGGAPFLVRSLPIRTVYDQGIPKKNLDLDGGGEAFFSLMIRPYAEMHVGKRVLLRPGMVIPLESEGGAEPALKLRCLAIDQRFVPPRPGQEINPLGTTPEGPDHKLIASAENQNSAVFSLLTFGRFRFYDGGDLNWYQEEKLVSPYNLVGRVDVFQVDTHGLDTSNPPILLWSLSRTVAVMPNGPKKGGAPATLARLKALSSIKAVYQLHCNVMTMPEENTDPAFIANIDEGCAGNYIRDDGRWGTEKATRFPFRRTASPEPTKRPPIRKTEPHGLRPQFASRLLIFRIAWLAATQTLPLAGSYPSAAASNGISS